MANAQAKPILWSVGDDVDGGTSVVNISKDIAWLATSSIIESLLAPRSPKRNWDLVMLRLGLMEYSLYWNAVGQNEDQSNDVHDHEGSNDDILHIEIRLATLSNTNQHPTDA